RNEARRVPASFTAAPDQGSRWGYRSITPSSIYQRHFAFTRPVPFLREDCPSHEQTRSQEAHLMFRGIAADAPSRKHLRHWERVCLSLDSQPYRAVRYPFPTDPPVTARLLRRMARFGLVRHKDDCSWQLSLRWRSLLRRLWEGTSEDEPPLPID